MEKVIYELYTIVTSFGEHEGELEEIGIFTRTFVPKMENITILCNNDQGQSNFTS